MVEDLIKTSLAKLSADMYGKRVALQVLISGQSNPKNIPKFLTVKPEDGEPRAFDLSKEENWKHLRNLLFFPRDIKGDLAPDVGDQRFRYEYSEARANYYILFCRDIPGEEKFDEAVYRSIPVHLIGQQLPSTKRVRLEGRVVDDDKRSLTILAYLIRPIEERHNIKFSADDYERFKHYFNDSPNLRESIDRSIQPLIVGRPEAKLAAALTLCSPQCFYFEGELVRGNLHTAFIGDSTTGKSRILEWVRDVLKLGQYGVGDMSTYAGLLAAVDTDKDVIIWGLLPMADRELALIDSFQKIHPDDLPMFREALRDERIVVTKKVTGEAACRTRLLVAANPNKVLDSYIDSAEALVDLRCLTDPVDLTRWDLFIRFHSKDVPDQEIANSRATEPVIPVDVMRKFILWAWSLRPEQIKFDPEAEKRVKEAFLRFNEFYHSDLPLVHKGFKEVIARIAASFAVLHYSVATYCNSATIPLIRKNLTNENVENTVTSSSVALLRNVAVLVLPKHVEEAETLIEEELEAWEYRPLVLRKRGQTELTEAEAKAITTRLKEDSGVHRAWVEIARNPGIEATTLAEKFKVSKSTISRDVAVLKEIGMVESKERRRGYWLTPKGIAYLKSQKPPSLSQEEKIRRIFELIEHAEKDSSNGVVEAAKIVEQAMRAGIPESSVREIIKQELQRGHLSEAKPGWIQRTVR
jgi:DNA-binding transcriptional ArsR family regulator